MTVVIGMTRAAAIWLMYLYIKWSASELMTYAGGRDQFRAGLDLQHKIKADYDMDNLTDITIAKYLNQLQAAKNIYRDRGE